MNGAKLCTRAITPQASMTFLRAMLCIEKRGPVSLRNGEAWKKPFLTTRAVSCKVHLQRLSSHFIPTLAWGAPAWHMRKDTLSTTEGAVIRMARIGMHEFHPAVGSTGISEPGENRELLTVGWGCGPAVLVAPCAVSGAGSRAGASRPAWP